MAAHVCASSGMVAAILSQIPLSSPAHFSVVNMLLKPDPSWSTKLSGRLLPGQVLLSHTQLCIVSNCARHQVCPHLHLLLSLCACMCTGWSAGQSFNG